MKERRGKLLLYFSITIFVISFLMVTLKDSYAFYENETKFNIINSKVKKRKEFINLKFYVWEDGDYVEKDVIPTSDYKLSSSSYCDDTTAIINYKNGLIEIDSLVDNQSCYIYFDLI